MKPPVIIIAAGRSGTKLLRDLLCMHPLLTTWPCDEINPIWRYRNARFPSDELPPDLAREPVKRYIRGRFEDLTGGSDQVRVVEKTCANSLRVEFVRAVFPEAFFVHLIRDGRDVAASAHRRWRSEDGLGYLLRKARFIPLRDAPHYAWQFAGNHLSRLLNEQRRLSFWGPRFAGLEELLESRSLLEVCGVQWSRCVEASRRGLAAAPPPRVLEVRYESLARDPEAGLERLFGFLGLEMNEDIRRRARAKVSIDNIGKWRRQLSSAQLETLLGAIGPALEREGYPPESQNAG